MKTRVNYFSHKLVWHIIPSFNILIESVSVHSYLILNLTWLKYTFYIEKRIK